MGSSNGGKGRMDPISAAFIKDSSKLKTRLHVLVGGGATEIHAIIKDLQNTGVGTPITFPFHSPTCQGRRQTEPEE